MSTENPLDEPLRRATDIVMKYRVTHEPIDERPIVVLADIVSDLMHYAHDLEVSFDEILGHAMRQCRDERDSAQLWASEQEGVEG